MQSDKKRGYHFDNDDDKGVGYLSFGICPGAGRRNLSVACFESGEKSNDQSPAFAGIYAGNFFSERDHGGESCENLTWFGNRGRINRMA